MYFLYEVLIIPAIVIYCCMPSDRVIIKNLLNSHDGIRIAPVGTSIEPVWEVSAEILLKEQLIPNELDILGYSRMNL